MPEFGRRAHGGEISCKHCGGPVDADGMAFGGDVKDPDETHESYNELDNALKDRAREDEDDEDPHLDEDKDDEIQHKARFAQAIRRRKR